jgi:hypothetical protein
MPPSWFKNFMILSDIFRLKLKKHNAKQTPTTIATPITSTYDLIRRAQGIAKCTVGPQENRTVNSTVWPLENSSDSFSLYL